METFKKTVIRLEAGDKITVDTGSVEIDIQVNYFEHRGETLETGEQTYVRVKPLASKPRSVLVEEHGHDAAVFETERGLDISCK